MITRVCAYDTVFSLVKGLLGISLETSFRFFRLALFALLLCSKEFSYLRLMEFAIYYAFNEILINRPDSTMDSLMLSMR